MGALAEPEFDFILVDSLNSNPLAGETFLWDINEAGVACGVTTIDNVIGYPGMVWEGGPRPRRIGVASPGSLNNFGLVVGIGLIEDLSTGQQFVPPNLPGTYYQPSFGGVNDAGIAVGSISITSGSDSGGVLRRPYLWSLDRGAWTIEVPNARGLNRINASNVAIGWLNGWVLNEGFAIDLETGVFFTMDSLFPGGVGSGPTRALDINDHGDIVGTRFGPGAGELMAYVYSPSSGVTILPFPGPGYQNVVHAMGINNDGVVVGSISGPLGSASAFVYTGDAGIRNLNNGAIVEGIPAGYRMTSAQKVNHVGWIVGLGSTGAGKSTGFVLRPRGAPCPADLSGSSDPSDPAYGVADGMTDAADFFYYLDQFVAMNFAVADISGSSDPSDPAYGIPDGALDASDFFYYLDLFVAGCP